MLCSDPTHPVNVHLERWIARHAERHRIQLLPGRGELPGGDLLLLVSCSEIIDAAHRARYRKTLLLHASDLPSGRGWSPHVWQILAGATELTVTLLEAADQVDTGRICAQLKVPVPEHALWHEINEALFEAEIALMDIALRSFPEIDARPQDPSAPASYYRRRTPLDSRIDPEHSICSQFNLIRVCDPTRFPAFFDLYGCRYAVTLRKISGPADDH